MHQDFNWKCSQRMDKYFLDKKLGFSHHFLTYLNRNRALKSTLFLDEDWKVEKWSMKSLHEIVTNYTEINFRLSEMIFHFLSIWAFLKLPKPKTRNCLMWVHKFLWEISVQFGLTHFEFLPNEGNWNSQLIFFCFDVFDTF